MHIETPRLVVGARGPRATARIRWEGAHRGPGEMWFETDERFAADFEPAPEAFAVAAMPMACGLGEPRLAIDAPLCPRLHGGLVASIDLFASWYPSCRRVPVEAAGGLVPLTPRGERRVGAFLSGGIDSLSMLRVHRHAFPQSHPWAIRDGIFLFGGHPADLDGGVARAERRRASDEQRRRLERLGRTVGVEIVALDNNVHAFHPDFQFTKDLGFGAAMIASSHLFRRRLTDVWYASHGHGPGAPPHASHVALDPLHSTSALEVHVGEPFTRRMDKIRTVAGWPEALDALQVCLMFDAPAPGRPNCGRCEKCRRTILALLAIGRLDVAGTLTTSESPLDVARAYRPAHGQQMRYASEIADAIEARGQGAVAQALRRRIARAARKQRRRRWRRRIARWVGLSSDAGRPPS